MKQSHNTVFVRDLWEQLLVKTFPTSLILILQRDLRGSLYSFIDAHHRVVDLGNYIWCLSSKTPLLYYVWNTITSKSHRN